jgi:hypothetical protein
MREDKQKAVFQIPASLHDQVYMFTREDRVEELRKHIPETIRIIGNPMDIDFSLVNKMQLNCHPFSWTEKGFDNRENFYILTKEKQLEALHSINEEIKTYLVRKRNSVCSINIVASVLTFNLNKAK